MEVAVFYLLMVQKFIYSKQKILKQVHIRCVWVIFHKIKPSESNLLKSLSVSNMKKIELYGVDYDSIDVDDVSDIYKYLMKKHNIKSCLVSLKKIFDY